MTFVVCIELAENAGLHNIILQTPDGFLSAIKKHQKMLRNTCIKLYLCYQLQQYTYFSEKITKVVYDSTP